MVKNFKYEFNSTSIIEIEQKSWKNFIHYWKQPENA